MTALSTEITLDVENLAFMFGTIEALTDQPDGTATFVGVDRTGKRTTYVATPADNGPGCAPYSVSAR